MTDLTAAGRSALRELVVRDGRSDAVGMEQGGAQESQFRIEVTRTPGRRRRRRRFFRWPSFQVDPGSLPEGLSLDSPLAFLVGIVVLATAVLLFGFVLPVMIGFLITLGELLLVIALALVGSAWAWVNRHPRIAVLTCEGRTWHKTIDGAWSRDTDAAVLAGGAPPESIGYRLA